MAEPVIFGGSPLDQYLHDAHRSQAATFPDHLDHTDEVTQTSTHASRVHLASTPHLARSSISGRNQGLVTAAFSPASATTQSTSFASPLGLVWRLASTVLLLTLRFLRTTVFMFDQSFSELQQTRTPPKMSTEARESAQDSSNSFVERFKYVICSSFLLTPSLSISFYESSPPFQSQQPDQRRESHVTPASARVKGARVSTVPICKHGYAEPTNAPFVRSPSAIRAPHAVHKRPTRLDPQGRLACNVAVLSALLLLPPISPSWWLWFSTWLLIASFSSAFVILLNHSSVVDKIEFTISRQSIINPNTSSASLRNLSISQAFDHSEKEALQRAVLKDVSGLVKAAQCFDISINKAISAVQEVEVVSRGYRLSHPLPPISRIEAASALPHLASPARKRRSIAASPGPTNGQLGRSLSGGGNGAPTVRRHTQRPLSLNLSSGRMSPLDRPSGRSSPVVPSEAGLPNLPQKLLTEQSTAALATGRPVPMRLIELRKAVIAALDNVGVTFTSIIAPLQTIADAEELALLHELYALDGTLRDESNEVDADALHAWSNADISALSDTSHDLEHDRKPWIATTPRNFGSTVRSATGVDGYGNILGLPDLSPQTTSTNHKRLSLVSDAGSILDRPLRASPSLSRCSSLVSETDHVGNYRSPRFNYVSEKSSGASGPNESAAAKRLSYVSNSSSSIASPVMRNSSVLSSTFTPPHSSAPTYSAATSPQSRATKRSSIVGPNSIFAQLDPNMSVLNRTEPTDPLSLLTVKAKFEWMHRARRRWLCHLLALNFTMSDRVSLSNGDSLPCDEYWTLARSTIASVHAALQAQTKTVTDKVASEMGLALLSTSKAERTATSLGDESMPSESRHGLLAVPNGVVSAPSIIGHPGIEDRLYAMMLSLRSLQSKIRVCAEDIRVKAPPGLYGFQDTHSPQSIESVEREIDDVAATLQLEKTLESMREDFLGLSAEWESTIKLIHKEKRRSPSPQASTDNETDVFKANAARELVSPLEADEDAADSSHDSHGEGRAFDDVLPTSHSLAPDHEPLHASGDEDDADLAALLLSSTSPNSLPPPGLEQVFESIAGMARLSGLEVDASKPSRAERIEQAHRQREQRKHEMHAKEQTLHRHTMDPSSMMSELNEVISSRKAVREQHHRSSLPYSAAEETEATTMLRESSAASFEAQPALALGSPLDLGATGHTGVFGGSPSLVDEQAAMPRRSLSSLDLARARALQALEARSPSVASSASYSFDSGEESMSRHSDDFSFEPTALESVPENETASLLAGESPSVLDSASRKSTPKAATASLASLNATPVPVPDSPFDLGAQVAAYARRKKEEKRAAMQASRSGSSVGSQVEQ